MIRPEVMEVMKGHDEIPFENLTQDIIKDFNIITYYLAEKLPKNTPFDLGKFDIVEFNENMIVVQSNDIEWLIKLENIYNYDNKLGLEYIFYTIREE